MDVFDLARESKRFSEHLDAWMCEATPDLFCWLDGYLTALHDAGQISDDERMALVTMLSMMANRGSEASTRQ